MFRRVGWGLADQALSSLTNFALGILVVRSVDTASFGAFSFAFAAYAVGLGIYRSLAAQPLVIRYSASSHSHWSSGVAAAAGVALWVGLLSTLAATAIGIAASGALRESFLALALVFPGLLLQDNWRYGFFAEGHDSSAFLNDLAWAIVLVPAMVASIVFLPHSVGGPLLAWGGAATAAGCMGYAQARVRPRPAGARVWLREHSDLAPRFVGEFVTTLAASQLSLIALGAIAGLAAAGTLRAGGLLLGPLNILYQGVGLVAVPQAVAVLARSDRELRRFATVLAVGLAAVALAWGVAVFLLPSGIGTLILGSNWGPAHDVVLPLALGLSGAGVNAAALVALRALAAARHSFRANTAGSALLLGGGVLGAAVAAARGVAWAHALASWAAAWIWWRQVSLAFRQRIALPPATPAARTRADGEPTDGP